MRELRRMVGKVTSDPARVELRADKDLKASPTVLFASFNAASAIPPAGCHGWHRPAVSCPTAWTRSTTPGSAGAVRPCACILGKMAPAVCRRGTTARVLRLRQSADGPGCQACGHDELVAVFRTTGTRSRTTGNATFTWHDSTCPACGQRDRQVC